MHREIAGVKEDIGQRGMGPQVDFPPFSLEKSPLVPLQASTPATGLLTRLKPCLAV